MADKNKTFKIKDLKNIFTEALAAVAPDNWPKCEQHILKEEESMRRLDHTIDDLADAALCIHVGETSSSESDED